MVAAEDDDVVFVVMVTAPPTLCGLSRSKRVTKEGLT